MLTKRISRDVIPFAIIVTSQLMSFVISNMYQMVNTAHDGATWGRYCYGYGGHVPTCGWNMVVSVSYKISMVEVWQSTATKIDDYTYRLTPTTHYGDTSHRQAECNAINMKGSFGSTQPVISVVYTCVCTAATDPSCESVPYTLVSPWDATTPITTTPEDTTQPTTTVQSSSHVAQSYISSMPAVMWIPSMSSTSNVSSIKLKQVNGVCYTGGSLVPLPSKVEHFPDCGSFCLADSQCEGINYHTTSSLCGLVHVEPEESDLSSLSGCQYWRVVWKR